MKKLLLLLVLMLLPYIVGAETVEIGGIYYILNENEKVAEVTENPNKYKGEIVIPEAISNNGIEYNVTGIGNLAFSSCSSLTSIIIPNSVITIGGAAFYKCTGLTSVTIPTGVTTIALSTFCNCSNLTSVTIPKGITSIGSSAFEGCPELLDVYCYAENVPNTGNNVFTNSYIETANLFVPEASISDYMKTTPWRYFRNIKPISGEEPEGSPCAIPTISYKNRELTFNCDTEGVQFVSEIQNDDIKKYYDSSILLTATYKITVYATKTGFKKSQEATATLCWIDAEPKTEGITGAIANIPSRAALIQSQGGIITIQGIDDGTQVNVYNVNGTQEGSAICRNNEAVVNTNLQPGTIAIVKIGTKNVKVLIK